MLLPSCRPAAAQQALLSRDILHVVLTHTLLVNVGEGRKKGEDVSVGVNA